MPWDSLHFSHFSIFIGGIYQKVLKLTNPWILVLLIKSYVTQYGQSQFKKELGVGDKYHRSIKVHT